MSTAKPILTLLKASYSVRAAEAQMAALQGVGDILKLDPQAQYAKARMKHSEVHAPKPAPRPDYVPSIKPGFVF